MWLLRPSGGGGDGARGPGAIVFDGSTTSLSDGSFDGSTVAGRLAVQTRCALGGVFPGCLWMPGLGEALAWAAAAEEQAARVVAAVIGSAR
jgi:hypothetical protein